MPWCAILSITLIIERACSILFFFVFSVGAALLQSAHLRAPKGVVPTRRRRTYTAVAALATLLQVLTGWLSIDPGIIGALLFIPIFYVVNKVIERTSLRLRYTFRIGPRIYNS